MGSRRDNAFGFTLVEVVMSIGIVAAVMIPLVILLSHGLNHAEEVTARDRVLRLAPTVEDSLNSVPYDRLKNWVDSRQSLYAYVYRGSPQTGMAAKGMGSAITGRDTFFAVARTPTDAGKISREVRSLEGDMFRVELGRAKETRPLPGSSKQNTDDISIAIEARFSRVMSPSRWQSSVIVPQMSLNYVVNR